MNKNLLWIALGGVVAYFLFFGKSGGPSEAGMTAPKTPKYPNQDLDLPYDRNVEPTPTNPQVPKYEPVIEGKADGWYTDPKTGKQFYLQS